MKWMHRISKDTNSTTHIYYNAQTGGPDYIKNWPNV